MSSLKYPIIQYNGQRIYHPSPSSTPPPRGTEVFVGNIPKDLFEGELIPMFSKVGPIYKLRLMMNFSGRTRGFAFVSYYSVEDAQKAVTMFDNTLIRSKTKWKRITVHFSLDNCKLFFGNIPRYKTAEQIEEDLGKFVDGVVRAIVYAENAKPNQNRGFAFVEFESHAMAAIARRRLLSGVVPLWGNHHRFHVEWAEPEPIVEPAVLMQVKILYFKNVPLQWNIFTFKRFIFNILYGFQITKIHKKNNYAFVHFETRDGAEIAMDILDSVLQNRTFSGHQIEVEWSRPPCYSKRNRANQVPDNFCTSVPPNIRQNMKNPRKNGTESSRDGSSGSSSSGERNFGTVEEFLALNTDEFSRFV